MYAVKHRPSAHRICCTGRLVLHSRFASCARRVPMSDREALDMLDVRRNGCEPLDDRANGVGFDERFRLTHGAWPVGPAMPCPVCHWPPSPPTVMLVVP